jgi:hypothetical protein
MDRSPAHPALGLSAAPKGGNGTLSGDEVMWPADIARLLDAASGPLDRALYAVAAMGGLRKGESSDSVGETSTSWAAASASGSNSPAATWSARRSRGGRPVPMAREVALALLKLRETSRWTAPDDLVFAEPRNGRRTAWTPARRRYLAALKTAKLQRFSLFQDLRHSFA